MDAVRQVVRFGPYEVDLEQRTASHDGRLLTLTPRNFEVLARLLERPGEIIPRETLIARVWRDRIVGNGSLDQAISTLRGTFDDLPDGAVLIDVKRGIGLRFAMPVETVEQTPRASGAPAIDIDALLAPHMAFVSSRADLEALDRQRIPDAIATFTAVLTNRASDGKHVTSGHIGMANALVLLFESTRADAEPEYDALHQAEHFARLACQRAPKSADAWGALALVFHRLLQRAAAMAAAREAVSLAPKEWRHHLRLAFVASGAERLRAAERVLDLSPGNPLAHWLIATVLVARQAMDGALEHLGQGCDAQDTQRHAPGGRSRVRAVGLHWLRGLVFAATGERHRALAELEWELTFEGSGHIYERETGAATRYAIGVLAWRAGDHERASASFSDALGRLPGHLPSAIALRAVSQGRDGREGLEGPEGREWQEGRKGWGRHDPLSVALAQAIGLSLADRRPAAAASLLDALAQHADSGVGPLWLAPVEPSLDVSAAPDVWRPFLHRLRDLSS